VGVEQHGRPVGLGQFGDGDGPGEPTVVGLAGELEDPARHHDRNTVRGELLHERVKPFPGSWACDRYAAARRRTSSQQRLPAPQISCQLLVQ